MTLLELIEQYGFGIKVKAKNYPPFTILSEMDMYYKIQHDNGSNGIVLKECPTTNDYELA